MTERVTMPLWEPVQAHKAFMHLYNTSKPYLMAGIAWKCCWNQKTAARTTNRHLHSLIGQIAKQLGATVRTLLIQRTPSESWDFAFRIDTRNDPDLMGEWAKFEMYAWAGPSWRPRLGIQSRDFTTAGAGVRIEWRFTPRCAKGVRFKAGRASNDVPPHLVPTARHARYMGTVTVLEVIDRSRLSCVRLRNWGFLPGAAEVGFFRSYPDRTPHDSRGRNCSARS